MTRTRTDYRSAPAVGYEIWMDAPLGWRFTSPDGDYDSRPHLTRESANEASHKHAEAMNRDALLSAAHRNGHV